MGLFSIFSKNKQESTAQDSGRFSRDDDDFSKQARAKRASYANEAGQGGSRRSRSGGDPMLPEKKRARRRLVGAIALALAAAVGLPMLLDSEPRPLAGDIAIQIPSKEKAPPLPVPSNPVPIADSVDQGEEIVVPAGQARAPAAATPGERPARETPATPVAEPPLDAEPKPVPPKPASRPVEPKPEPKTPERKVADKPAPKKLEDKPAAPRARDEEAARALALLEGKSAAKPEKHPKADEAVKADKPEAGQRFAVQVAALASQDKVAELQSRLRAAGVSASTRKSGELIKVHVGPFASREEAEKARAKLASQGFGGFLVPM